MCHFLNWSPTPWQWSLCCYNKTKQHNQSIMTYNGHANYETWNASLWIGNDEFLYATARACVMYAENETPWTKFVRCMTEGQIGRFIGETGDGVRWDDPAINADKMNEMMAEMID